MDPKSATLPMAVFGVVILEAVCVLVALLRLFIGFDGCGWLNATITGLAKFGGGWVVDVVCDC